MKESEKKKPIQTIPKGVWEASRPENGKKKGTKTTDLQGNGYPANKT